MAVDCDHLKWKWKATKQNNTWRSRDDKTKGFETAIDIAAQTQDIKESVTVSRFRKYYWFYQDCEQNTLNYYSQILDLAESETIPENSYCMCNEKQNFLFLHKTHV